MRKRVALLTSLVMILVALALPASVAAAPSPYTYKVPQNYCDGPMPTVKIKMIKPAGYYPDRFTITARGQHSQSGNGGWSNEGQANTFSRNVPNQNAKFTWTQEIYWSAPDMRWHRMKLTLKVWDGGSVVASKTIYSVKC